MADDSDADCNSPISCLEKVLKYYESKLQMESNSTNVILPFLQVGPFKGIRSLCLNGESYFSFNPNPFSEDEINAPLLYSIMSSFLNHLDSDRSTQLNEMIDKGECKNGMFAWLAPIQKIGIRSINTSGYFRPLTLGLSWLICNQEKNEFYANYKKEYKLEELIQQYANWLEIIIYAYEINKGSNKSKHSKNEGDSDKQKSDEESEENEDSLGNIKELTTLGVFTGGDQGVAVIAVRKIDGAYRFASIEKKKEEEKKKNKKKNKDSDSSDESSNKNKNKKQQSSDSDNNSSGSDKEEKKKKSNKKKSNRGEEEEKPQEEKMDTEKWESYAIELNYLQKGSYTHYISDLKEILSNIKPPIVIGGEEKGKKIDYFPNIRLEALKEKEIYDYKEK